MTDSPFVILRNTISGIAHEFTPEQAQQWLAHPVFGKTLEEVRTAKPEVLADRSTPTPDVVAPEPVAPADPFNA